MPRTKGHPKTGGRVPGSKNKLWSDSTIRILDAEDRLKESVARVLLELQRLALNDPTQALDEKGNLRPISEWPLDLRRSISGLEVSETKAGESAVTRLSKVRFADKRASLESIGKHLGMYVNAHRFVDKAGNDLPLAKRIVGVADETI